MKFFVEGIPKAQPRLRHTKDGHGYTPDDAKGWRELIWIEARKHRPPEPHLGPVTLIITFYMPRPKGHFSVKGEIRPKCIDERHTSKPDLDNMEKAVKDELENLGYYRNDSQVYCVQKQKLWAAGAGGMDIDIKLERK